MSERIAVLGAGSWGTALANLLAKKGHDVIVWSFEEDVAAAIARDHENPRYMKGITLSERMTATKDMAEAVRNADVVLSVTPAQHVRKVMQQAVPDMR